MDMQDKDIDELFRAKLDNVEVEPSVKVWKGIVVELDGAKQKRTLIPVMRIAASVTVILGIGLFFLLKGTDGVKPRVVKNITKKHGANTNILRDEHDDNDENNPILQSTGDQQLTAEVVKPSQTTNQHKENGSTKAVKRSETLTVVRHSNSADKSQSDESAPEISTIAEPYTLAAATGNDIKITKAVVPDEALNDVKPVVQNADEFKTTAKPVVAQLPAGKGNARAKKHSLNSIGDLINVVVAKVDKRQDKVIEFSNTDDDESTITGLNLGIVKVKKDK
ncbi:hypothetical protein [Mucilaginibacter agri]|uniref:Uncharacterized protein n=1 Tax=Mucilaginibacter agri TaxID=2695265 RepID=A0A966DU72_9SPHI|nr:hypothetical protein [Mucilaginibacter agri]NCD71425.1 hypothetical protein [Mucilaginibacter agri]